MVLVLRCTITDMRPKSASQSSLASPRAARTVEKTGSRIMNGHLEFNGHLQWGIKIQDVNKILGSPQCVKSWHHTFPTQTPLHSLSHIFLSPQNLLCINSCFCCCSASPLNTLTYPYDLQLWRPTSRPWRRLRPITSTGECMEMFENL